MNNVPLCQKFVVVSIQIRSLLRKIHNLLWLTLLSTSTHPAISPWQPNLLISPSIQLQWRWMAVFWKALIELYRLGVQSARLADFLSIDPVKKRSSFCTARSNPARQPYFHSRGQNLSKIQHDHRWNRLFKLHRLVPSLAILPPKLAIIITARPRCRSHSPKTLLSMQ